jgi:hypothetical protein
VNLLKLTLDQYITARNRLIDLSLIAFENGRYQVLELPEKPSYSSPAGSNEIRSIKQVLDTLSRSP